MTRQNEPPNPAGSSNEKMEVPVKSWPDIPAYGWKQYLLSEGIDPDLAEKLSRAFANAAEMQSLASHENYRTLEHWANSHTHPSTEGGSGGTSFGDLFVTEADGVRAINKSDGSEQFVASHGSGLQADHIVPNTADGGFISASDGDAIRVCSADGSVERTINIAVDKGSAGGGGETFDYHADSGLLVVNDEVNDRIDIINYSDGSLNTTIIASPHEGAPVHFSPDGTQIVTCPNQTDPTLYALDGTLEASGADHGGFMTRSLEVSASYVVAGGGNGALYCYNRSDMSTRWTKSYGGTNPRVRVAVNSDETLVFASCDYDMDGTAVSSLRAYDASSGQFQYGIQLTSFATNLEGGIAIFENVVYGMWEDGYVTAHAESDLSELWVSQFADLHMIGHGRPALAVS